MRSIAHTTRKRDQNTKTISSFRCFGGIEESRSKQFHKCKRTEVNPSLIGLHMLRTMHCRLSCQYSISTARRLVSAAHGKANTSSFSFSKLGVPSPVTGSHPRVAFQVANGMMEAPGMTSPLCVLLPLHPMLCPRVISFSAVNPIAYNKGLTNPSDDLFPARNRASFKSPIIAATTGEAADVPPDGDSSPP